VPLPGEPDETALFVSVPVRHPLSDHLLAEFGGRYTERAPAWPRAIFSFHQRQLWAYVMLAASSRSARR